MILAGIILNVVGAGLFVGGFLGFLSGMFTYECKPGGTWFGIAAVGSAVWALGLIFLVTGLVMA